MNKQQKKKGSNLNIFITYNLVTVITGLVFYKLFPLLLNYPPGSINTKFNIEFSLISYYQQYIIVILLVITIGYICFKASFKDANKWKVIEQSLNENNIDKIKEIRRKSFNMPHIVYILQVIIPLMFVFGLFMILGFRNSSDIKFFMILTTLLTLAAAISYLFSKKYFRKVLKLTYIDVPEKGVIRIGLPVKIILQILPLFLLSILFIAMVGNSGLIKEKGNAIFKSYSRELLVVFNTVKKIETEDQLKQYLNLVETDNNDITFYISPTGRYKTRDNSKLNKFFLKYTKELAFKYQGHTYDYYGSDVQGAVIKLPGVNGDWIFGIKYIVASPEVTTLFIISFFALFLVAVFILLYFGKAISDDITLIASGLTEIAEGEEVDLDNKIAVTSMDEIGDLAVAFNKVQDREKKHIQDIKEQQKIIMERERLVSLGQMMGGITHNLKFPIVSIGDHIEHITDVANDLEESVTDETVEKEDYLEMIKVMKDDLNAMKPFCSYMSEILSIVEEQAVQLNSSIQQSFTITELKERIVLLMNHELNKYNCKLKLENKIDPVTIIKGEINNLVQVINNIILNSIQAYEDIGEGGTIELMIEKKENKIIFTIRDYAKGIAEDIQNKLFQEMVTTKGSKGSGLGLYMSRLTIKGRFGGELIFKSKEGEGSTFFIIIPYQEDSISNHES